jgi:hypothetical protein
MRRKKGVKSRGIAMPGELLDNCGIGEFVFHELMCWIFCATCSFFLVPVDRFPDSLSHRSFASSLRRLEPVFGQSVMKPDQGILVKNSFSTTHCKAKSWRIPDASGILYTFVSAGDLQ